MNSFQELQKKHMDLLRRYETNKESADFIKDVREYTEQVLSASREISDSRERNQLRANLRFWGAYIYDHTGTYPNLSLLPSEGGSEAPPSKVESTNSRGIIIVFLIIVTLVVIYGLLPRRLPYSQSPDSTNTPIDPNDLFATPIGESTDLSDVQVFATGTAIALTREALAGGPTETTPVGVPSSATPTPLGTLPPGLTPGSNIPGTGFVPDLSYSEPECSERMIIISWRDFEWNESLFPGSSGIQYAVAHLSSLGTGEVVSQVDVLPSGDPTTLELGDPDSDQSYFLQIKHSVFLFEPMIIQFTADCTYNHVAVTYSGRSDVIDRSTLVMELNLVDWGPVSLAPETRWIAQLTINRDAGGIYLYNGSPMIERTLLVTGSKCSSIPVNIGRTSNGKYQAILVTLHLAGPLCPKTE